MREGWELKRLEDVCEYDKSKHNGEKLPYVGMENIKSNTGEYLGDLEPLSVKSTTFRFSSSHLLYGRLRPYLNKVLIPDFDGHCSTEIFPIKPSDRILKEYLFYWFVMESTVIKIDSTCTGARMPRANMKEVIKFQIPIPPLSEQKQIVALLDKAFAAIDQAKAHIEKNIVNAKELFDSKKEETFEKLALKFEPKSIVSVCKKIFAGGDAPKDNFSPEKSNEFDIPIIANAVKDNGLYGYTNEARVIEPSITIAARGSGTGHTEYRNYPYLPIVRLIVLIPNTSLIDAEFLMYAIKNLTILRSGSAIPQLTVPMIKSYSIPVPEMDQQMQVVRELNKLELHLDEFESKSKLKLIELKRLKNSILQKAFSGELTE